MEIWFGDRCLRIVFIFPFREEAHVDAIAHVLQMILPNIALFMSLYKFFSRSFFVKVLILFWASIAMEIARIAIYDEPLWYKDRDEYTAAGNVLAIMYYVILLDA